VNRIPGDLVEYASSVEKCLKYADCVIDDFIRLMHFPTVDGRRIYNPDELKGKVKFAAIGLGGENSQ